MLYRLGLHTCGRILSVYSRASTVAGHQTSERFLEFVVRKSFGRTALDYLGKNVD